jgi:hypothetical protein
MTVHCPGVKTTKNHIDMKRFLILAVIAVLPIAGYAQPKQDEGWKERIMNEKIAFFTTEMQLTAEEAQAFWPVYNSAWEKIDKAHHQCMRTYKALSSALKEGKGENETKALLEAYLKAVNERNRIEESLYGEYSKVLPPVKVAKLYVAEEKFRRQQIHKLHQQPKK